MELHAPRSEGTNSAQVFPAGSPTPKFSACVPNHTERAAQTWHRGHTNANSTNGLILIRSLADETDRLLVKNYKYIHAI